MSYMKNTVCFTGHRPQNLSFGFDEDHPDCIILKHELEKTIRMLIEEKDAAHFISGAALGVDMWAMEIVLKLKCEYPDITLESAVHCRTQSERWSDGSKARYDKLLSLCDKVTVLQEAYTPECMMHRNRYMVDSSDFVIAVWNGKSSGTGNTVRYAQRNGKTVYRIDTVNFNTQML